ncbi:MAG: GTP 3',8-cyclase MoaA [Oscillospiraceae bacterium]|nr:GTP 3',8-cyclase MoaA [Oscillospiraceae bacterium]
MRDSLNRNIDYLRLSVTDRCNLRCKYCMPGDLPSIPHDSIMRYEEILRICAVMAKIGIRTVRVTGGEPLMRKGCIDFIKKLKQISGIENVTLTTNGVLLEQYIDELAAIKIDGVNISLDSLDADIYKRITGKDELHKARQSLYKAIEAGLKVKINCVAVKGLNESEILPIAQLTEKFPVDARFIELMPAGMNLRGVPCPEIIEIIKNKFPDLIPDPSFHGFGPARYFKSGGLKGNIGVIDAVSNRFCSGCNRLRLTGEGFLKLCLQHDDGIDLRSLLRSGQSDIEIQDRISAAVCNKPERHYFDNGESITKMSHIGG